MPLDQDFFRRLNLRSAVAAELTLRNRLLPPRWDYSALASDPLRVETWLRPRLRRGATGKAASVVLADKGWRGARPLHVMTLEDRVLYRALVALISETLPAYLRSRIPIDQFRQAALEVPDVKYISKTDVAAFYEFVDHELLHAELISQTGEELAIDALSEMLASVMGRRVGLPQVHVSSDVLGDTYIDPARRRLLRRGHATFTYSDDFRIASPSLGDARAALEACEMEVRRLGLVLNERKTYTYGLENYGRSLTSFREAERRLFSGDEQPYEAGDLGFLDSDYEDAEGDESQSLTLGTSPLGAVDEDEMLVSDDDEAGSDVDRRRVLAAQRAWDLWEREDESEETQAGQDAAITQSLLGRALRTLGAAGNRNPLYSLSALLRFEPALTPQVTTYVSAYAENGVHARRDLRSALDEIVSGKILSAWQGMWIAHALGGLGRARRRHVYEDWLEGCTTDAHDGIAATAAAALGRIGRGDSRLVAAAVERVGPEWRRLAYWGLIGVDRATAAVTADDDLDRLLLAAAAAQ